jgi:hypothetical protein
VFYPDRALKNSCVWCRGYYYDKVYYFLDFLCLAGIIIGTVVRKKLNVSKKVHDIVSLILLMLPSITVIALINTANISLYDLRIYIPSVTGLAFGWVLSSLLVKKQKEN